MSLGGVEFGRRVLAELERKGIACQSFTIDMTGGGRAYENWTEKEKRLARSALIIPEPPYAGYGIDRNMLSDRHPYHGLNENGKRHAACSVYIEIYNSFKESSRNSKLVFR